MQKKFHQRYYPRSTKTDTMMILLFAMVTITLAGADPCNISRSLLASSILKKMDLDVDPCDDFYQFACGNFIKETIIPDCLSSAGTFEDLDGKLENQLHAIISNGIKEEYPPAIKSMENYYQACMNTDQIENNSLEELQQVMKKLGGCPLLEGQSWNEMNFDWIRAIIESNKIGYSSDFFIRTSVDIDPDNSSRHILNIDQASSDIPHENLIVGKRDTIVQNHLQALIEIFEFLGTDKKVAEKELGSVIDFEIGLADISFLEEEQDDSSRLNNRMTLEELETNFNGIAWAEFLNEILVPYVQINQSEEIIVAVPSFLESLPELIANTPKRVLANYVCVRTIWEAIDNMGERFLSTKIKDINAYAQITKNSRWKYCLKKIVEHFSTAVGWLYVKNHFGKDAKVNIVEVVNNVRASLISIIRKTEWIPNWNTKCYAMYKIGKIVPCIGYPDEFDIDGKINEAYQNLTILSQSFFESELTLKQFFKKQEYSSLRKLVNETSWIKHGNVAMVNAEYSFKENSLYLPAGILQGEFFSKDRPNYMNYAAIGSFVGHELSHAYDQIGNQYDTKGNVLDWWDHLTRVRFSERAECLIKQYSNYTVKEVNMKVDGYNTLNENFADINGLRAAYTAYNDWAGVRRTIEDQLPRLDYTPNQMFWITFANAWCAKYRPEFLRWSVQYDVHAPPEFRVIGTLSNMEEFSKDFNCPMGSPMNPVEKCSLQ